jgi:cohesin complex subunit SA-1/2
MICSKLINLYVSLVVFLLLLSNLSQKNVTEYSLISRAKGTAAFKETFTSFMRSLTLTIAKSDLLYDDPPLVENISSWIASMCNTHNRPFRHTATVAALSILSALCEVGRGLADVKSKLVRQIEGEKKKGGRNSNKGRVAEMEKNLGLNSQKEAVVKDQLESWFDSVFVHRYRDVDHHIRLDCMQALSDWIMLFPNIYLDGSYLRYFGWTLSDLNASVRLEILKGLLRIYKDNSKLHGVRAFTERFRPRIIEMATRDSDLGVRIMAIELMDVLRETGHVEPNDIDSIGKLVFDSEQRIRKAVVKFFAQNVDDIYDMSVDELGGLEGLTDVLGTREEDDDLTTPCLEWLHIKSLVDQLISYDASDELEPDEAIPIPESDNYVYVQGMESRFSVAAEGLCEHMENLEWELLAGYLLYDHSQTSTTNGAASGDDLLANFKRKVKLTDKEEILLLEILNASVKFSLFNQPNDKTRKLSRAQRLAEESALEEGSRNLAGLIPRLLNKFGAVPEAASAIIRLEHVISPDAQDAIVYSALLEDVKKQFQAHAKPFVLQEASRALLHGRSGEAEESAQAQITGLIEDSIDKLVAVAKVRKLNARGNLDEDRLEILLGAVLRLEMLGSIEDITTLLETVPLEPRKKTSSLAAPVDMLLSVLGRGVVEEDSQDTSFAIVEDNLVIRAAKALSFYFLWKIQTITKLVTSSGAVPSTIIQHVQKRKAHFIEALSDTLSSRSGAEEIRLSLAVTLIDLHVAFAGLVHLKPAKRGDEDTAPARPWLTLVAEIPKDMQLLLLQILSSAEKSFAKRTKRQLEEADQEEEPGIEDEPEDDESEDEEMPDADDENAKAAKLAGDLVAEQRLCDLASSLVLGLWAAVLDGRKEMAGKEVVRKRLRRNKAKLGHNFKACIDKLEKGGATDKGGKKGAIAKNTKKAISNPTIEDSEEEDEQADARVEEDVEEEREETPEQEEREKTPESVLGD